MGLSNRHTIFSDGGLAVNIAESLVYSQEGLGVKLDFTRKLRNDELLFGECQSAIVVSLSEDNLIQLVITAKKYDVPTQTIGRVNLSNQILINNIIKVKRDRLEDAFFQFISKKL